MAKKQKIAKRIRKMVPKPVRKFMKNQGSGAMLGFVSGFIADTAVEYVTRLEQRRRDARQSIAAPDQVEQPSQA